MVAITGTRFRLASVRTPAPVAAGSAAFILIFYGYNFFGPDVITAYFNGTALDYPLIESANVLSATVPAALVAEPGDYDCWLDGNDAPYGVTNHVIFTVITADGLPPILPGDPCNIIDETRKASDGSCVKCVANVWTATAAGDCEPSAGGDLGDLYVYGLETHEKFFDHFEVEMRDAPDGTVLQYQYARGHYTESLDVWTMDNFALFEGVTQGQTYYFRARVVTANGVHSEWTPSQSKMAEILP